MKTKYALILFILGFCIDFLGAFMKITHQAYGDLTLLVAMTVKIIGAILLLYKTVTNPKLKDILNW